VRFKIGDYVRVVQVIGSSNYSAPAMMRDSRTVGRVVEIDPNPCVEYAIRVIFEGERKPIPCGVDELAFAWNGVELFIEQL
jgi:hypothetical protein